LNWARYWQMAWESRDLEGYLIKKTKLDDDKIEVTQAEISENSDDFDPESEGGSDNEER
jgi:hypothetical protein